MEPRKGFIASLLTEQATQYCYWHYHLSLSSMFWRTTIPLLFWQVPTIYFSLLFRIMTELSSSLSADEQILTVPLDILGNTWAGDITTCTRVSSHVSFFKIGVLQGKQLVCIAKVKAGLSSTTFKLMELVASRTPGKKVIFSLQVYKVILCLKGLISRRNDLLHVFRNYT
jgi:hypothetical protein